MYIYYTYLHQIKLYSYWAGYQLLATHNYINKYDYPTGLLASVFQIDENFKQIYYGALSSNQNHNCCRLVKLSFRALAEFRRFNCSVSGREHRSKKLTTSIFSLIKRLQKSSFATLCLNIHLWIKIPSLSSEKSRDSADQQKRDPIIRQNTKKTKIRPKRIVLCLNSICECVSLLSSVQIIMNRTENIVIQNIRDATSQPCRKLCQASKDTQGMKWAGKAVSTNRDNLWSFADVSMI